MQEERREREQPQPKQIALSQPTIPASYFSESTGLPMCHQQWGPDNRKQSLSKGYRGNKLGGAKMLPPPMRLLQDHPADGFSSLIPEPLKQA